MNDFTDEDRRSITRAHERIDKANDRISKITELTIQLVEQNKYQEKRTENMEKVMAKHMDDEEKMWKGVDKRLRSVNKTMYIAIAVFSILLILTSDGKAVDILFKLFKMIP